MRRLLCLLLLICTLPAVGASFLENRSSPTLGGAAVDNSKDFLPVRQAFQLNLSDTTPESIKLQFVATEGYYLYRHRFQFRTEPADIGLGVAQLPDGEKKHDEYFGDVEVYHGILDVALPRKAEDTRPFTLIVTYQGCADKGLCYPPETERLSIGGASPAVSDTPLAGDATHVEFSWKQLALFFLAGVGLTFTPCVLPMLPILSGVVLRGQIGGLRGFSLSLAYVLPMAICFAILGAVMGMFGASLNLQARLQSRGCSCRSPGSLRCLPSPCSARSSCACPARSMTDWTGSLAIRRAAPCGAQPFWAWSLACWFRHAFRHHWPARCFI